MSDLTLTPTPARQLIEFIVRDFSVDGAHMLMMGYGENSFLGFGKFRGEVDCNYIGYRNFIREIESKIDDRPGYLSFLCLTSYVGAQPPDGGTIVFSQLREPRKRYGWLLNDDIVQPLSSNSLKAMVAKERRVKLADASAPKLLHAASFA